MDKAELEKLENDIDNRIKAAKDMLNQKEKDLDMKKAKGLASARGAGQTSQVVGNRSTSVESKCLQAFGCNHPAELLTTNVNKAAFAQVDVGLKQMAISFKEAVDISRFSAQVLYRQPLDRSSSEGSKEVEIKGSVNGMLDTSFAKDHLVPMLKAFDSTVPIDGGNWVPTAVSTQYIEEFELEKRVASSFREMPMPTNPFKLSIQTSTTIGRIVDQNTAISGTNFNVGSIDFDAKKYGEFYPLPEELNEDSAPAILQIARAEVAEALIRARETLAINGDDSLAHMDSDVTLADDARKGAKGLRKLALDNSANGSVIDFGASAVTTAKLDEMRTAMGKFGIGVRNLAYVFSPTTYNQAVSLDEVTSVEKFGGMATIVTGSLAAFRGIPVIISEFVREDLNAAGVHDGVTTDLGLVHLVNLQRFWYGIRRPIQVRVQLDLPNQDRFLLAAYCRKDFKGHEQNADEVSSVLGVNVAL